MDTSARLDELNRQIGPAKDGVAALQGDSTRMMDHLAKLQEDHTEVRAILTELVATSDSHSDTLKRVDDLWADLHRDMTALADALSHRENG